jgi:hypothetical protein
MMNINTIDNLTPGPVHCSVTSADDIFAQLSLCQIYWWSEANTIYH